MVAVIVAAGVVTAAYSYSSSYSDDFDGQDVEIKNALLISKSFNGSVSINEGNLLFGSSDVLNMNYSDVNGTKCYLKASVSGLGAGNVLVLTIRQTQSGNVINYTGSAVADSEGVATIHGFGTILSQWTYIDASGKKVTISGDFVVSGSVAGAADNEQNQNITITAYPILS